MSLYDVRPRLTHTSVPAKEVAKPLIGTIEKKTLSINNYTYLVRRRLDEIMDLLLSENWPDPCSALGLDCGTCTRKSASTVAKICFGLEPQRVQRAFI